MSIAVQVHAPRRCAQLVLLPEPLPPPMPRTRAECRDGARPCPHQQCEHHLADTAPQGPGLPSCVLDVAEQGGLTLDEVGQILGVSRERVRQIETAALRSARATAEAMGHDLQDLLPPPAPVGPWPERSRAPRRDWSTVKRKRAR